MVWIALVVFVLGTVGGLAYAALRALALWRGLKRAKGAFGGESARITRALDEITVHLDRAGAGNERLSAAGERLRSSRERLHLQLAALREARAAVASTFWFLPGR